MSIGRSFGAMAAALAATAAPPYEAAPRGAGRSYHRRNSPPYDWIPPSDSKPKTTTKPAKRDRIRNAQRRKKSRQYIVSIKIDNVWRHRFVDAIGTNDARRLALPLLPPVVSSRTRKPFEGMTSKRLRRGSQIMGVTR